MVKHIVCDVTVLCCYSIAGFSVSGECEKLVLAQLRIVPHVIANNIVSVSALASRTQKCDGSCDEGQIRLFGRILAIPLCCLPD